MASPTLGRRRFNLSTDRIEEKYLINTKCAVLDMATASFYDSHTGHVVVNGGCPQSVGFVGPGNSFKSKLLNFFLLSAYKAVTSEDILLSQFITMDTEVNISIAHLAHIASVIFKREVPVSELVEFWEITDKTMYAGDEWVVMLRKLALQILKEDKKVPWYLFGTKEEPHLDYVPRMASVDSLTELEPAITEEMIAKATKEDSSTNMVHMKKGLFKTKFISELPKVITKPNIRFGTTAHLGVKIEMDPNAKYKQNTKDLMFLKEGEVIKGVSGKFLFLISTVFSSSKSQKLMNRATKEPEYPAPDSVGGEVDLQLVHLQVLRNKHGASGVIIPIVVSQYDGVQTELTDFRYIKEDNFGIFGNNVSYRLHLYPDEVLTRPQIRVKLNENPVALENAIYLTASMKGIFEKHKELVKNGTYCSPEDTAKGIKEQGYDLNLILENSNPIYTILKAQRPYLSVVDIMLMAQGKSKLPESYLKQFKTKE